MRHSQRVLQLLEGTLSDLRAAETGQRGYLLSGDSVYLQPYLQALNELPARLDSTRLLTRDNPAQQERLRTIAVLTARRLTVMKEALELRNRGEPDAAVAIVRSGVGRALMDSIRTIMQAMSKPRQVCWPSGCARPSGKGV